MLPSIQSQINDSREIIIVDDGSIDGSPDDIAILIACIPNIKLLRQPNGGRSVARNAGTKHVKGKFIVFIDDDIIVPPRFLDRIEMNLRTSPDAWITGSVIQDVIKVPHYDFLKFRSRLDYVPKDLSATYNEIIEQQSFTTQQLGVRLTIFESLGGFDERLTDSEDFELSVRVKSVGQVILHDLKNTARHADYTNFHGFITRQIEYRRSKEALAKLHLNHLENLAVDVKKERSALNFLVRRVFVYNSFWRYILHAKVRLIVPERIRFKIFDLVLSSTVIFFRERGLFF